LKNPKNTSKVLWYVFYKPLQGLTRPLGKTKEFKGLVVCTKCNRHSYDSGLGFYIRLFFFFARGQAKNRCGVFVRH